MHILKAKWRLLCLLSFIYFNTRPLILEDTFSKLLNAKVILSGSKIMLSVCLSKMFSSIQFKIFLRMKTKCANINHKFIFKTGEYHSGNDILYFQVLAASCDVFALATCRCVKTFIYNNITSGDGIFNNYSTSARWI